MIDMYEYENNLKKEGYKYIVGTDEVGRGPMAGPLVVAAVILPDDVVIEGLNDSKKLTSLRRGTLPPHARSPHFRLSPPRWLPQVAPPP